MLKSNIRVLFQHVSVKGKARFLLLIALSGYGSYMQFAHPRLSHKMQFKPLVQSFQCWTKEKFVENFLYCSCSQFSVQLRSVYLERSHFGERILVSFRIFHVVIEIATSKLHINYLLTPKISQDAGVVSNYIKTCVYPVSKGTDLKCRNGVLGMLQKCIVRRFSVLTSSRRAPYLS